MRVLVTCVVVLAFSGGPAGAASFQAPERLGAQPTLGTAAAAGGGGTFAFVARQYDDIVGAVRPGTDFRWKTRALAIRRDHRLRDPQIVIDDEGAVTALWTAEAPRPALVAARAPAGAGFGAAHAVARLNRARSARPRMVVLRSGQVLVAFADRSSGKGGPMSLKTLVLDRGRPSAVHDVGADGSHPAIAQAGRGAILVYVGGPLRCARASCAARPVRAALLDADGRRSSGTVTVTRDGFVPYSPPRVASDGSRAVISWVSSAHWPSPLNDLISLSRPFTREYRTGRLRPRAGAQPFPMYRGESSETPSVAVLRSGDLVGTNVRGLSVASNGAGWQPLTTLGGPDGWGEVPRVRAFGAGQALAVIARRRDDQTPAYDVTAVERSPTGTLTPTTLGTSLRTYSAVGLSMSVAADGQAIVTWPHATGGVDVVLRR